MLRSISATAGLDPLHRRAMHDAKVAIVVDHVRSPQPGGLADPLQARPGAKPKE
jgi:hypothetical protein